MSQKVKRGVGVTEDKSGTESPVKDMKKKVAANAEKEKQMADQKQNTTTNQKPAPANEKVANQKPAPTNEKTASANQKAAPTNEKTASTNQKAVSTNEKTASTNQKAVPTNEKTAAANEKPASASQKTNEKASNGKSAQGSGKSTPVKELEKKDKVEKEKIKLAPVAENAKAPEAAKQNGASTDTHTNGTDKALNGNGTEPLNGTNGSADSKTPSEVVEVEDDEAFPELVFDESADDESVTGRGVLRRSQVKTARADKTEEKSVDVTPAETKADTKLLKLTAELPTGDKNEDKPDEETEKDVESTTSKSATNFSKSRVKVSPYRRSMRLQDSMVANYSGNNTTMETDISELSQAEDSYVSQRSIRGRRSYKRLGQYVPPPMPARQTDAVVPGSRPTVHVVGRKRKTADEEEQAQSEAAADEAGPVKRSRLLERVVTPLAALYRRRVASSTPLDRQTQIVGINSDIPLQGKAEIEPESLPVADALPAERVEVAVEATEHPRAKCVVM